MASVKIIARTERARKNGEVPLYVRLTVNRKSTYFSLGQFIPPRTWDAERERVRKSHPNAAQLNALLLEKRAEISAREFEAKREAERESTPGQGSFFRFADSFLERLRQQERIGTLRKYEFTVRYFRGWLLREKEMDDLLFPQLSHELAVEFKSHLESGLGNAPQTVQSKFNALKSIVSAARDAGIVDRGFRPLAGVRIKVKKAKKQIPSRDEVAALESLDLRAGTMHWHIRNLYLFCAGMAGMRFGDAVTLRWASIVGDRLQWTTRKTNKQRLVYIPQSARDILESYRRGDSDPSGFIFPFLRGHESASVPELYRRVERANTGINPRLRKLWRDSGAGREYSFHTSRHFFATDSLRRGMRVEVLQHLLTHGSLNQTMDYARIANDDMDAAMMAYEAARRS